MKGQSLLDIAVQWAGTAEAAIAIANANLITMADDLQVGQILIIPDVLDFQDKKTALYFSQRRLKPATAVTDDFISEIYDPGIGEMIIEKTFIIR